MATRTEPLTPEELRTWRSSRRLSQGKLATLLQMPAKTIQNWEQSIGTPPVFLWRALRDLERDLQT